MLIVNFFLPMLTARRSSQSILKEISPEYSLEGLMLKLKFQHFGHLMWRKDRDAGKRPWCWEKLMSGGEVDHTGWYSGVHHWLDGHEFVHAPGFDDGQGSLACCSPWGHKESDRTEWLNWTDWELQTPISSLGTPDFLSTSLGNDSLLPGLGDVIV